MLSLNGVDNGPYTTTAQKDYAPHDRVAVNGGVCGRHAAQLIGALPILAGCAHPERTALSHLTTLIAASRNPHVFGQKPSESIRDRLRPIETFENGDRDIIERGMTLLELASLSRAILATPACDGRRDRDHRQPLALVLISQDPDAARSALRSFGFSITVPITRGGIQSRNPQSP